MRKWLIIMVQFSLIRLERIRLQILSFFRKSVKNKIIKLVNIILNPASISNEYLPKNYIKIDRVNCEIIGDNHKYIILHIDPTTSFFEVGYNYIIWKGEFWWKLVTLMPCCKIAMTVTSDNPSLLSLVKKNRQKSNSEVGKKTLLRKKIIILEF